MPKRKTAPQRSKVRTAHPIDWDQFRRTAESISRLFADEKFHRGLRAVKALAERAEYAVAAKHSRTERREIGRLPFSDLQDVIRPYLRLHRRMTDDAIDSLLEGPPGTLQILVREIEDDARAKTGTATTEDLGLMLPASWYFKASGEELTSDTLRKARLAGHVVGEKRGARWYYSLASVLNYYGAKYGKSINRAFAKRNEHGKQGGNGGMSLQGARPQS